MEVFNMMWAIDKRNILYSQKFALWIGLASISMMFAGFLSAYIVRQAAGNWLEFQLPILFTVNTAVIALSSFTIHIALNSFRSNKEFLYKFCLILTCLVGVVFVILQYKGWLQLFELGIDLKANPSGSFVYVISGVHVAHVLGGIAALTVALVHAFALPFRSIPKRVNRLEMTVHYWHFVGVVWVILFLFFTFYRY